VIVFASTVFEDSLGDGGYRVIREFWPLVCWSKARGFQSRSACVAGKKLVGTDLRRVDGRVSRVTAVHPHTSPCRAYPELHPTDTRVEAELPGGEKYELRTGFAVWPADADVGMRLHGEPEWTPTVDEVDALLPHAEGEMFGVVGEDPTIVVTQTLRVDLDGNGKPDKIYTMSEKVRPPLWGQLFIVFDDGRILGRPVGGLPVRPTVEMTTDLDGDGHREILLLDYAVNEPDFGAYGDDGTYLGGWGCSNA
jgi:hypothetical protein